VKRRGFPSKQTVHHKTVKAKGEPGTNELNNGLEFQEGRGGGEEEYSCKRPQEKPPRSPQGMGKGLRVKKSCKSDIETLGKGQAEQKKAREFSRAFRSICIGDRVNKVRMGIAKLNTQSPDAEKGEKKKVAEGEEETGADKGNL